MTGSTPYGLSQENLQKLKSRHQSTLNSIRDLQNFERSMYSKLDTGVANKSLTKPEQEQVIQKINELSAMRSNLFNNLKDVYVYEQGNVSETRNDLVNQMTTAGIIENELNNAKKTLQALEDERSNSLRMVEINEYYGKKYGAQADLMKTITLFCIPLLILAVLMQKEIIPKNIGGGVMSLVLVIAIIYCGRIWWDISSRDNMNFDEYNWYWSAAANDPTVYEYDKEQIDGAVDGAEDSLQSLGKDLGTCIGNACCSDGMTFDDSKKQCVEGFTKLISNTAFSSHKEPISYRQTNGSNVKPYSANSRTFSSV
tara:strand:- start:2448 stop:3383 length:936 start_codon:yes stop_codon:yes gene_type:complete